MGRLQSGTCGIGSEDCDRWWVASSPGDSGPEDMAVIKMLKIITLFQFADASLYLVFVGTEHPVIAPL